jgi:hypothetical protein
MPEKKDVNWDQVQLDRAAGVPVSELAKRYAVHITSVYNHTKAPAGARPRLSKGPGQSVKTRAADIGIDLPQIIKALIARRDKIDRTIATLRELV